MVRARTGAPGAIALSRRVSAVKAQQARQRLFERTQRNHAHGVHVSTSTNNRRLNRTFIMARVSYIVETSGSFHFSQGLLSLVLTPPPPYKKTYQSGHRKPFARPINPTQFFALITNMVAIFATFAPFKSYG